MVWNPEQYEKYRAEREAPFQDLLALIASQAGYRAIDLGCGTGRLTRRLHEYLPQSEVLGIDQSAEMLRVAQSESTEGLRFQQQDILEIEGEWDLIFSHAALQWLPDHPQVFATVWDHLKAGGQIAIQMPSNHDHTSHQLIRELANKAPFVEALQGWQRSVPVLSIEAYANLLYRLGAKHITVLEKIYPHILPTASDLMEWVKGTALLPYLERLSLPLQAEFLRHYQQEITAAFPENPVFYGFRRILIHAHKV